MLECVFSVLAGDRADIECLVVDQSKDEAVGDELRRLHPRVRHLRTRTRGLSAARNIGLRLARHPIVAMTDDDCRVDRRWASEILRAFDVDPRVGLVFGNVLPAPCDRARGFIPGYVREDPYLALTLDQKAHVEGMGACMALRRQTALDLGGFDERLGAGSPLRAGEDVDLTLRMLSAGHAVFETPAIQVVHYRFERWAHAPALARSYWLGAGAALGKHVRRRPARGAVLLGRLAGRFVFSRSRVAKSLGPHGLAPQRLLAFVRGLAAGVTLGVDLQPAAVPSASATGGDAGSS